MNHALKGLSNYTCHVDNVLIFSLTFKEHFKHQGKVLLAIGRVNLKVHPSICVF